MDSIIIEECILKCFYKSTSTIKIKDCMGDIA